MQDKTIISVVRDIAVIKDHELNIKLVRSLVRTKLELTRVDIEVLLRDCRDMVKGETLKRGIRLLLDMDGVPDMKIKADERKLRQILYNLLSNAVRFTPEGGEVSINARTVDCIVRPGRRQGDTEDLYFVEDRIDDTGGLNTNRKKCLQLSVSDNGIGVKFDDLERIFNVFEQVKSPTDPGYGGSGLGLFLARRLVETHGGMIWAESKGRGEGSTFSFIIPGQLIGQPGEEKNMSVTVGTTEGQRVKSVWRQLLEQTRNSATCTRSCP